MLKADKKNLVKSKAFDHTWIIEKAKTVVLGLDTKINKRVTMRSAMISFVLMKQYDNIPNAVYLTQYKSMAQILKIRRVENTSY